MVSKSIVSDYFLYNQCCKLNRYFYNVFKKPPKIKLK